MNTETLPQETTEEISQDDEYCHLRHEDCPSIYAVCGEFKPFPHSDGAYHDNWRLDDKCPKCNKVVCPKCISIDIFKSHVCR